jgi:hypothetical protein
MTISSQSAPEPKSNDGLDRLLREYFGSKIPQSFPPLSLDSAQPATPRMQRRSPMTRSRLTLAACVAAIAIAFGYLLSSAPVGQSQKPIGLNDSSAKGGAPHTSVQLRK